LRRDKVRRRLGLAVIAEFVRRISVLNGDMGGPLRGLLKDPRRATT
jgi:hypothetical protein